MKKIVGVLICVCTLLCFVLSGCKQTSDKDCIFLSEEANLHDEYLITVLDFGELNEINVLKNSDDEVPSKIIGTTTHFLFINLKIEHQSITTPKENHKLDKNDFKIKDHTGVQIKNVTFIKSLNSCAKSEVDFSTRSAIVDYTWVDKAIESGNSSEICVYFEFDNEFDIKNTLMVLEVDFFATKKGTDIVLMDRVEELGSWLDGQKFISKRKNRIQHN